jgi:uncharacterized protein (DUF2062 family)
VFKRLKVVICTQLTQGLRQRDCCQAIAVAVTVGVFPIMGCSTLINSICAARFKLNQPIVQGCNWLVAPVKIALIFPFLRLGEWLFQAQPFQLSLAEFSQLFFSDIAKVGSEFAMTFVHAISGWFLCLPLIYALLFQVSRRLLARPRIR